jgi:aminopeptidase N
MQTTVQALELYSQLFGAYDRPSLTLVESTFPDGMEYDGLYFLGQEYFKAYAGGADNYLTALSAHETAHQWWYAMTANDQALEPWLDEALATYSERLFYEQEYPDSVDWWVKTRIEAYQPEGYVNSSIYDFTAFRPYVNAVYLRGTEFLQALREQMGDQAFLSFLKDYYSHLRSVSEQDNLGLASADFFWNTASKHYSGDLSELKQQFFK